MSKISKIQSERDALNKHIAELTRSNEILVDKIDRISAISSVAFNSIVIDKSDPDNFFSNLIYGPDMKHLFGMISKITYEHH